MVPLEETHFLKKSLDVNPIVVGEACRCVYYGRKVGRLLVRCLHFTPLQIFWLC